MPDTVDIPTSFEPLKQQLLAAAESFSSDALPLAEILAGLVDDVERASREPLEIFPVCHHSPASAAHMVRRLARRAPRVIYMECCEDLRPLLDGLVECKLPVALQAFAASSDEFPSRWAPLSIVCPLSEFSAEFQAIAFSLTHAETELVFVDRSTDHLFQWMPRTEDALLALIPQDPEPDDADEAGMHGSAIGVEMGRMQPTFGAFRELLLKNARVQHFSEWWDQYVEEAIIDGDYATYRQVMFLIGSLFRRLGMRAKDIREDEQRERYMWTRIKQHLARSGVAAVDAIYICGAAHSASRVEEFGLGSEAVWEIPPATSTPWLYGILPSSHSAIEHQFGHPRGSLTLAEARWKKSMQRRGVRPFALEAPKKKSKADRDSVDVTGEELGAETIGAPRARGAASKAQRAAARVEVDGRSEGALLAYMQNPPPAAQTDEEELLTQCVRIVQMARKHGYLASTADSIAVYHTAVLLANMRQRRHPTPYDFRDAAVTCIEKDRVPGRRSVERLCDIMLGGDRVGKIGYSSLPPLARDVYDRLAVLPIDLEAHTIQRALLDFRNQPEYMACSDLLWKLRYLMPGEVIRPIMGQRELGHVPVQESWDVAIGKHQGSLIQLGYEGVTVEYVLERRLKKLAFAEGAQTSDVLKAAEDSILFLKSDRLTEALGERSIELLAREASVTDAKAIYARITRLIHYYRSGASGLPAWCKRFVTTGYSRYATLLPAAFADRGVRPDDLTAMLQFVLTLESLALSLGSERSELVIAVKQSSAGTTDPTKLALLWATECVLGLREVADLRPFFTELLENELTLPSLPHYLAGFLLALAFTPMIGRLAAELMSRAFERLPDRVLMPWMPQLLMMLRPHAKTALPALLKEVTAAFPRSVSALDGWTPPWDAVPGTKPARVAATALCGDNAGAHALLRKHPASCDALAADCGIHVEWGSAADAPASAADPAVIDLLKHHPAALSALGRLF